jgi:hypothetical protein
MEVCSTPAAVRSAPASADLRHRPAPSPARRASKCGTAEALDPAAAVPPSFQGTTGPPRDSRLGSSHADRPLLRTSLLIRLPQGRRGYTASLRVEPVPSKLGIFSQNAGLVTDEGPATGSLSHSHRAVGCIQWLAGYIRRSVGCVNRLAGCVQRAVGCVNRTAGCFRRLAGRGNRPVSPSNGSPDASNRPLDASPGPPDPSGSSPDASPGPVSPSNGLPDASNRPLDPSPGPPDVSGSSPDASTGRLLHPTARRMYPTARRMYPTDRWMRHPSRRMHPAARRMRR